MRPMLRLLVAAAVMASLAALPAAAAAREHSSPKTVRQHARAADKAFTRTAKLIHAGKAARAARSLATGRRQLRLAGRQARRLTRRSGGARSLRRAALAEGSLGLVAGDCIDALIRALPPAGTALQPDVAAAIEACAGLRAKLVGDLEDLVDLLPESVRPRIAKLISLLSTGSIGDVKDLTGLLGTPLPPEVAKTLTEALGIVSDAIDTAIGRLDDIVPLLPSAAQPVAGDALALIKAQLPELKSLLEGLLGGLPSATPTPPSSGPPPADHRLGGLFDWLNGLLAL